jgi:hypothetical protein
MNSKGLVPIERLAFEEGWNRASKGLSRSLRLSGCSYNERAAFADGWDCFHEQKKKEARDIWKTEVRRVGLRSYRNRVRSPVRIPDQNRPRALRGAAQSRRAAPGDISSAQ